MHARPYLQVVGRVIVDDQAQVLDVEAARGDGGGDEDVAHVALEVGDGALAVGLLLAAVQRQARVPCVQGLISVRIGVLMGVGGV
jgi:hypothetical protein